MRYDFNQRTTLKVLIGVILLGVGCRCSWSLSPWLFAPGATPEVFAPTGKIVYQTDQYGPPELCWVDLRTRSIQRLTENEASDILPTYNAATGKIAFLSDRDGWWNIYEMTPDDRSTSGPLLQGPEVWIDAPSWSHDGKWLVASVAEKDECHSFQTCLYDLYLIEVATGEMINLTHTPGASEWTPEWSPDDQFIAVATDRDGDSEIYILDREGRELRQLTHNRCYDGRPRWSPDGRYILYETDCDGGDWDLYIMDVDGGNRRPLTTNATQDYAPAWSPGGYWIAYASDADGDYEIYILTVEGKHLQRITRNFCCHDTYPSWIP